MASFSTPSERDALIDCFSQDVLPEDIRSSKKAAVEVLAYSVEPEFVRRYIQQYDTNQDEEKKVPSDEERIESVKSRINPKTEFHVWLYQNRRWMKAEHKNVYIKN